MRWTPGLLEQLARDAPSEEEQRARDLAVANDGWLPITASDEDVTRIGRARLLIATLTWDVHSDAWPFVCRTRPTYRKAEALCRRIEDCESPEEARRCR